MIVLWPDLLWFVEVLVSCMFFVFVVFCFVVVATLFTWFYV